MRWLALPLLLAFAMCAPAVVPFTLRPNTSGLVGLSVDSVAVVATVTTYREAHPKEAGMCYYGGVRDTVIEQIPVKYVSIDNASPARVHYATDTTLFLEHDVEGRVDGCVRLPSLLGVGHSHPYDPFCSHSDIDALFLLRRDDILFSLIFCGTGGWEVLWQDGRRARGR